ncbi:MAG: UDP-N-acetylglucosamine pyrophosphorylase [Candidatus Aureabacteria bacterium]|nr:UDP-N-acetylglucosamine pyrophosphorylase [Candidatus Auribacterota bacterium]NLW94986.1 UDP-N-acetylglucosamine pyrophosphorylase [Chlamydiota bacterium]HOE26977.1 UDP-N-acetylglucosamine pyrophosphorylase [bacterium]HQM52249.1 UDP-N-acetylglucosamine pyrophosphorylase [bacterium]
MSEPPGLSPSVLELVKRGVVIRCPGSVEVDPSVDPARIAPGAIIHAGCRLSGSATSVGPGSELGKEGPVVLEDCQLGSRVALKGGFFSGATFLDGVSMGGAAHVRPGTLLEEEAGGAHAVGFKQTILLSYVTAGSLINFCDALMAGGTSRKDHSEIGSSYVHFNYTPHQDKATPSLVGDVPGGVMLNQAPIFLGGQGGLIGPVRIAYGVVVPAGTICRRDLLEARKLFVAPPLLRETRAFAPGVYRGIDRIVANNLIYIGNLWALEAWYRTVRERTMAADAFSRACRAGALARLGEAVSERLKRLKELAAAMPSSLRRARAETGEELPPQVRSQQQGLIDRWPEIEAGVKAGPSPDAGAADRDAFLEAWERVDAGAGHVEAVQSLAPAARASGTAWLQAIVDSAAALWRRA